MNEKTILKYHFFSVLANFINNYTNVGVNAYNQQLIRDNTLYNSLINRYLFLLILDKLFSFLGIISWKFSYPTKRQYSSIRSISLNKSFLELGIVKYNSFCVFPTNFNPAFLNILRL
jgi:hypothetical protein